MQIYSNAKIKLRNIKRAIDGLGEGDFALKAGTNAAKRLHQTFSELERRLDRAYKLNDSATLQEIANSISVKVWQALPVIGFLLRSTNVRNAFELLEPLESVARAVLQGRPELLLSSEWDYVPFAYPQSLEDLKSFVLIGLPASEAASALLVPLAGHELGHAVWKNRGIEGSVHSTLQYKCGELFDKPENQKQFQRLWSEKKPDLLASERRTDTEGQLVEIAMTQAEEIFCDLFAYALFSDAYLRAFAYILAPGSGQQRRNHHPTYKTRINALQHVGNSEGLTLPGLHELGFKEEANISDSRERFILSLAEEAVTQLVNPLWKFVIELIESAQLTRPNITKAKTHIRELQEGIPTHEPSCIGDIITAGWACFDQITISRQPFDDTSRMLDHLNELLLKSIEVLEFQRRVGAYGF